MWVVTYSVGADLSFLDTASDDKRDRVLCAYRTERNCFRGIFVSGWTGGTYCGGFWGLITNLRWEDCDLIGNNHVRTCFYIDFLPSLGIEVIMYILQCNELLQFGMPFEWKHSALLITCIFVGHFSKCNDVRSQFSMYWIQQRKVGSTRCDVQQVNVTTVV
jgi:hypothetical protein